MQLRKILITSSAVLSLAVLGAGVASAGGSTGGGDDHHGGGGYPTTSVTSSTTSTSTSTSTSTPTSTPLPPPPVVTPGPFAGNTETDTGWKPNTPFATNTQVGACWGTNVTVQDKYDRTQVRIQQDEFGSTWLHQRGRDVIKLKDNRLHKEVTLDNSGDFAGFFPAVPADTFYVSFQGKNLLYPPTAMDAAALAAAHLPKLPYLVSGQVDVLRANGIEKVIVRPGAVIKDACTLLKRTWWDRDRDRDRDHNYGHHNPPVAHPTNGGHHVIVPPCIKVKPLTVASA